MEIFLGAFTAEWERRKAALLHDLSLARRPFADEDEGRRRAGSVAAPEAAAGSRRPGFGSGRANLKPWGGGGGHRRADRPMRARFAGLSSGSQPAVVKMASFGGGARLGAMINYVSRNGALLVENERGDQLRRHDQLSAVGSEWDHLLKNRAESRDIGLFHVAVSKDRDDRENLLAWARTIVKDGLGDRAFAFGVTERPNGSGFDIDGVTVLRGHGGERLTADAKATAVVQQRMNQGQGGGNAARFQFTGYGNGTDYGSARLRSLVETHQGRVEDEQGRTIADARCAGDLVQLEWRDQLHSRKPRDVMHLILSARAGTDVAAFQDAARDFLGDQFGGHRYLFSLHDALSDPKAEEAGGARPHVHVHAIIAMRSDAGDRIETTIPAFRQWRLTMAEKARAHGINMEMTDRRDRASPAAYSKNQVRPTNTIGRTHHEGTSKAAQRRYDAQRHDETRFAITARSQSYRLAAQQEWANLVDTRGSKAQQDYVEAQIHRLEDRSAPAQSRDAADRGKLNSGSQFRTHLVGLAELVSEKDNTQPMTRAEFELFEKRVETALVQAERTVPPAERKDFEEIATAARDHVNLRRELVELAERLTAETAFARQQQGAAADRRDDDTQRWNDAVARYGFAMAEAANKALLQIEQSRDAVERAQAGNLDGDKIRALTRELDVQLVKAAELAVSGNRLIRDVAKVDEELKSTLQSVELQRALSRAERPSSHRERGSTPTASPAQDFGSRDSKIEATANEPDAGSRSGGDTTPGNSVRQRGPRLEERKHDAEQRHERDDDDRER
jgi:hypothetical protein